MNTVLTHFYNEEYLLPWWLNHHKKMFDHGILIDYHSTDRSCEIIKEICPDWQIITTKNKDFDSLSVDREIEQIETTITGWRIALTVTEFLQGNMKSLDRKNTEDIYIESIMLIDKLENVSVEPDPNKPLIEQITHGVYPPTYEIPLLTKGLRRMSKVAKYYYPEDHISGGRHFIGFPVDPDFLISNCYFSPYTDKFIKRKLQIQTKMSQKDIKNNAGWHHLVTKEMLDERLISLSPYARDISDVYKERFNQI